MCLTLPKPEEIPETTVDITVTVTDGENPIEGAIVTIGDVACSNGTGSAGGCTLRGVSIGEGVTVTCTASGYDDYSGTADITEETTTMTITMTEETSGSTEEEPSG